MAVPQNVRTQFDTSKINTRMNDVEEANKESYYESSVYVPEQKSVNVAAKVAAGVPYTAVADDVVKQAQLDKVVDMIQGKEVEDTPSAEEVTDTDPEEI